MMLPPDKMPARQPGVLYRVNSLCLNWDQNHLTTLEKMAYCVINGRISASKAYLVVL
jgi:hypothetical protein